MESSLKVFVETLRGGFVESVSRVRAVVIGPEKSAAESLLFQSGDVNAPVFWRSAAKFIQALSLFSSGAVDRFALSDAEIALVCASHSGSDKHVAAVAALLERIGASVEDLHCAPHAPLGQAEDKALAARGEKPTKLHNNCSGKHTGMLAVCRVNGWPLADYNRISHPLQQQILRNLAEVCDLNPPEIGTAVDGCGAVVFRTPLTAMARAYARLLAENLPGLHKTAGQRILKALRAAPDMVAGQSRICTSIAEVSAGRLIGKVGADGVYALGMQRDGGFGLAVKIEDGNGRIIEPVVCRLAAHLGWLGDAELQALRPYWDRPIVNHQREQVGEVRVRID